MRATAMTTHSQCRMQERECSTSTGHWSGSKSTWSFYFSRWIGWAHIVATTPGVLLRHE